MGTGPQVKINTRSMDRLPTPLYVLCLCIVVDTNFGSRIYRVRRIPKLRSKMSIEQLLGDCDGNE